MIDRLPLCRGERSDAAGRTTVEQVARNLVAPESCLDQINGCVDWRRAYCAIDACCGVKTCAGLYACQCDRVCETGWGQCPW